MDAARQEAAEAQINAKNILVENGVEVVIPDLHEMEIWHQKMLSKQDEFVKILKIDPELVIRIMKNF